VPRATAAANGTNGTLTRPARGRIVRDPTESPSELRAALRPWIDLDQVGLPGLWVWLGSILPLLPTPGAPSEPIDPLGRSGSKGDRVLQLAKALTDCAGDRARLNFQASEYYADNGVLARRVRALEGMLRSSGRTVSPGDTGTERAAARYLPHRDHAAGNE